MAPRPKHRQVAVDHFRNRHVHQRLEDAGQGPTDSAQFVGRIVRHRGRKDRVGAVRQGRHMHHGAAAAEAVMARRTGHRPRLNRWFRRIDVALDDDLGLGGNQQLHGPARDHVDRSFTQQPRQHAGFDLRRQADTCRQQHGRIAA